MWVTCAPSLKWMSGSMATLTYVFPPLPSRPFSPHFPSPPHPFSLLPSPPLLSSPLPCPLLLYTNSSFIQFLSSPPNPLIQWQQAQMTTASRNEQAELGKTEISLLEFTVGPHNRICSGIMLTLPLSLSLPPYCLSPLFSPSAQKPTMGAH